MRKIICKRVHTEGFTLMELLVVISIIGMLSSVVYANVSLATAKARDTVRINDLRDIQIAVELYAVDHGGEYPIPANNCWPYSYCTSSNIEETCTNNGSWTPGSMDALLPYMKTVPVESFTNENGTRRYHYMSNGKDYKIISSLPEETYSGAFYSSFFDPRRDGGPACIPGDPLPTWPPLWFTDPTSCEGSDENNFDTDYEYQLCGTNVPAGYSVYSPGAKCW